MKHLNNIIYPALLGKDEGKQKEKPKEEEKKAESALSKMGTMIATKTAKAALAQAKKQKVKLTPE